MGSSLNLLLILFILLGVMFPPVLLGSPIHNSKDSNLHIYRDDYVVPNWFDHIANFSYPNLKKIFFDNSRDKKYHKIIRRRGYDCRHINPRGKRAVDVIAECYNKIRSRAIYIDAEYLMVVEQDNYPPLNAIEHLMSISKANEFPVVALPYFTGKANEARILIEDIERQRSRYLQTRMLYGIESASYVDGTIKPVYNVGMGCMLIHKIVLKEIPFRTHPKKAGAPDSFFAEDCWKAGIPIYADMAYICRHHNLNWAYANEYSEETIKNLSKKPGQIMEI